MTNLLAVIKENKGKILKRTLMVGGALIGLAIVTKMIRSNNDEEIESSKEVSDAANEVSTEV